MRNASSALALNQALWPNLNNFFPHPVTANRANGTCSFGWNTPPGQLCQIEYQTNLSQSRWLNLGGIVPASNGVVSATDSPTNSLRFYRLVVLP